MPQIPGVYFRLMGAALAALTFPRLRRADPHPWGLAEPSLDPVALMEASWDRHGPIEITLVYGDALEVPAPLVQVTTGLPGRGGDAGAPQEALAHLAHWDAGRRRSPPGRHGRRRITRSPSRSTSALSGMRECSPRTAMMHVYARRRPTFGIKLSARLSLAQETWDPGADSVQLAKSLLTTMQKAHDQVYVDQPSVASRTIFVDTTGYNATDFHLTPADKKKLFNSGLEAGQKFLGKWDWGKWQQGDYTTLA